MLHCPRCKKDLDRIAWRYLEPVDDIAFWDEDAKAYRYEDSVDKGELECVTLCYDCGYRLKDYGYDGHQPKAA